MKKSIMHAAILSLFVFLSFIGAVMPASAEEKPLQLVWWVYSTGDTPNDLKKVLDKANVLSAEKIGITVDMQFKTAEQFSLDMTIGEYYDMTFSPVSDTKICNMHKYHRRKHAKIQIPTICRYLSRQKELL